jgi:hypothetical protein
MVPDGLDDLFVFVTLLPEAARYGHSESLPFLLRLDGLCLYFSIQPPPDTVPTGLFLMVLMTFLLTEAARMRCSLQIFAPSGVGAVRAMRVDLSFNVALHLHLAAV